MFIISVFGCEGNAVFIESGLLTIILSVVASVAALAVLAIALIVTGKVRKKRQVYR